MTPPTQDMPATTETAPARAPARPSATDRLVFLDAVRGFALIFMVLNHTGRWWQDRSMGWPWYYSIYVTMAVAAPTFLFLVGFCLPLSLVKVRGAIADQLLPTLWKYAKRGGRIILAGLLLNVLVFPEDPFWTNGVLQTIGFGIIIAAPVGLLLRSVSARYLVVAAAVLIFLGFGWSFAFLKGWVVAHPTAARVLFFEFPPWPWVALVLFGLVPGEMFVKQPDERSRSRYMRWMAGIGVLCIAWLLVYDWWAKTPKRFTFMRDYILNDHWTPRGASAIWVIGMTFCLLAIFYYLAEVKQLRMTWLVTLGQTALFLYFIHQLLVLTFVNQRFHMKFNNWWLHGAANLLLMMALLGLGRAWIETKRLTRALTRWMPARQLLFSFEGRIPRYGFWLAQIYAASLVYIVVAADATIIRSAQGATRALLLALSALIYLVIAWADLGMLAKRWHDRGKSGWMSLILLVPVAGLVWVFVELGGFRGTQGPNRYGEDPLAARGQARPRAEASLTAPLGSASPGASRL